MASDINLTVWDYKRGQYRILPKAVNCSKIQRNKPKQNNRLLYNTVYHYTSHKC